ncbi:hypothetical protein [Nocardioides panacisoli]|uniref:Secreted protein n=1 Tax=Nocardioides panacisoli TaxID=627624 RepID=A0ABP7IDD3_9ACTN
MKKLTSRLAACALLAAAAPFATAGAAFASHGADDGTGDDSGGGRGGADVRNHGSCSGTTSWKIKAKPDDGRIEVEAEIDSNASGQQWDWVLKHNGSTSAHGTATTHGASGSFSVERRTVNAAGADALRFRATHAGETCVARVRL